MNEKILVTGASGFIGQRLVKELSDLEYDVWALLRYVTGRYRLGENVKCVFADVTDYSSIIRVLKTVRPEIVIHLAAISPVSYSYDHPQEVNEVNYLGTVNLAEGCRIELPHLKQLIFAGTSEEYGNQMTFPIKETAICYPNSPYALAKNASTNYLKYMNVAYDFPSLVLRPFNTYGRVDNTHFVTERIISQMLRKQKEIHLGDPEPVRDFMYVSDHVNGYITAIAKGVTGKVVNLCTGKGYTIANLVKHIKKITRWDGKVIWDTIPPRPLDIHTLLGNNSKARQLLGWQPQYSLQDGLRKTVKGLRPRIQMNE